MGGRGYSLVFWYLVIRINDPYSPIIHIYIHIYELISIIAKLYGFASPAMEYSDMNILVIFQVWDILIGGDIVVFV